MQQIFLIMPNFDKVELQREAVRSFMKRNELNVHSWSKRAGVSESAFREFLNGRNNGMQQRTLLKLAEAVNSSIDEILGVADETPRVPLVGYVGAGATIYPNDDYQLGAGMEMLDLPMTTKNYPAREILAVRVKGDSMLPVIQDGWIIYYHTKNCIEDCFRKICVIKVRNGATYVKELRKGEKPNTFTLVSYNARDIENVHIEWAYPIISIEPR